MGRVELILVLILALVYIAIPIITLILVVQINNRLKQIERYLRSKVNSE